MRYSFSICFILLQLVTTSSYVDDVPVIIEPSEIACNGRNEAILTVYGWVGVTMLLGMN